MINVKSTVKLNMKSLKEINRTSLFALEKTVEAVHTDLLQSQTMPFKKGTLQNDSTFVDYSQSGSGRVRLITSTPYGRRLYYHPEYNFTKTDNPNAGAGWYDPYIKGDKKTFINKAFAGFMGKGGGL